MSKPLTSPSPTWDSIVLVRVPVTFTQDQIDAGDAIVTVTWPAPMRDNNYSVCVSVENPQQGVGNESSVIAATFLKHSDGTAVDVGLLIAQDPGGEIIIHATAFHD